LSRDVNSVLNVSELLLFVKVWGDGHAPIKQGTSTFYRDRLRYSSRSSPMRCHPCHWYRSRHQGVS